MALQRTKRTNEAVTNPRRAGACCLAAGSEEAACRRGWLEGLFEHVADAIYVHDLEGRMVAVNPAACETFGFSCAELLSLHPWELARDVTREEMLSLWQELSCGWRVTVERNYRRKGGGEVLAEVRLTRTYCEEGDVIIALCRDITARRRIEEALRTSEQLARGQAEGLRNALDAVVREASPSRFLTEVLRTMTRMLPAASSTLWLQDESRSTPRFAVVRQESERLPSTGAKSFADEDQREEHPLAADVRRLQKAIQCPDVRRDKRFAAQRGYWLAAGSRSVLAVPLLAAGKVIGLVSLVRAHPGRFRAGEVELANALAHQVALAVQLSRLAAADRRVAILEERSRIARDIHDTLAQGLTGTLVQLEAARRALGSERTTKIAARLDQAAELARESLRNARRSVQALRSKAFLGGDLAAALDDLLQMMTQGTSVRATLICSGPQQRLPHEWQDHLLHIGREALTNAIRHSEAGQFTARLVFAADSTRLELADDGRGFDPSQPNGGFGLAGMRERAALMGGRLLLVSTPGGGTEISVAVPIAAP